MMAKDKHMSLVEKTVHSEKTDDNIKAVYLKYIFKIVIHTR